MKNLHDWEIPSGPIILREDEAHIWHVDIEKSVHKLEFYRKTLSSEELAKAERFHFNRDRIRHTITHGVLRLLISRYLSIETCDIVFSFNKYQKPELPSIENGKKLCFNLSHSGTRILYAFAWNCETGIDIEQIRFMKDVDGLIERFFSEREKISFLSLPAEEKIKAFFICWTRKEAYIKARGDGLYFPLDHFSVSLKPDEPPMLLEVKDDPKEKDRWSFHEVIIDEEYYGTLAIEGNTISLRFLHWQE